MQKIQLKKLSATGPFNDHVNDSEIAPTLKQTMHMQLRHFYEELVRGSCQIRVPSPVQTWTAEAAGHLHLATEIFLQISGWTRFQLPHETLLLQAGEVLLMPAKLLHAEVVGAGDGDNTGKADNSGKAFSNIVIYAEDALLTCHLAGESVNVGEAKIQYLESCEHAQRQHIQYWLNDAVQIAQASAIDTINAEEETQAQIRALVLAAIVGVMRSLQGRPDTAAPEPQPIAMARVLIQNQLGEHQLSVRSLAEHLGCSADHLSRLFYRSTGEYLVSYINRLRMARAARLLSDSELSAKEIAWSCGFVTQSYFIRVFRDQFLMTPKAWRKLNYKIGEPRLKV